MKLHFCEAIEIENLKEIESKRKYKNNKIGLLYLKEICFREIYQNTNKKVFDWK